MKKILAIILAAASILAVSCKKGPAVGTDFTVEIIASNSTALTGSPVTFVIKPYGGVYPYKYAWDFGDGLTGDKYEETVTYEIPGTKTVKVTVTDDAGVKATAETEIVILDKSSVPQIEKIAPEVLALYHNGVTMTWDPAMDEFCDDQYDVIFLDAAGTALSTITVSSAKMEAPYGTVLCVGNLKPSTAYKFKIRAVSKEEAEKASSDWAEVEFTTKAAPAPIEGAILEEHFDNFVWGPDYLLGGYGFRPSDNGQKAATSLDAICDEIKSCGNTTGDYFATFTADFRNGTGTLVDWVGSKVYGCMGFAKFGTSSAVGYLTTPALSKIIGMQDITVSFKAAPYFDWKGDTVDSAADIKVEVAEGSGTVENGVISLSGNEPKKWTEYSVVVRGATPATKIKITGVNASSGRYFLDDIVITAAASTAPGINITPLSGEFTSEGGEITFQLATNSPWKAEGVPAWVTASATSGEAGTYDIKFTAGKADADRSAEVTFTTTTGKDDATATITLSQKFQKPALAQLKPEVVKKNHVSAVVMWEADNTPDYTNTTYEFEFVDAAGTVLNDVKSGKFEEKYGTILSIGGLKPASAYKFRVRTKSTNEDLCESAPWAEIEFTTDAARTPVSGAIFEEYFDSFVWSAEYFDGGYGFRTKDEKTATAESPRNSFVNCGSSTGDYWATFTAEYRQICGIENWQGSKVYGHLGVAKMGTTGAGGWIQTPALAAIEGTKDIEVSFKISPYYNYDKKTLDSVEGNVSITAEGAGTIENTIIDFTGAEAGKWLEKTVVVKGATSATSIKWLSGKGNQRYFLDDIVIKVK